MNFLRKKICLCVYYLGFLIVPEVLLAVDSSYVPPSTPRTVNDVFFSFAWGNMKGFIPALIMVGLITFLSGVVKYVKSGDNEEARESGRNIMIYGIVVLFVMVSFWGLVTLVVNSFFSGGAVIPNYIPIQSR